MPRKLVILIVDDDVMIRNLVTMLMQDEGYSVLSASDGLEGLELSRGYPGIIDVVVTDLSMPRLNGIELCRSLLAERPEIKALVMSGEEVAAILGENMNLPFLPKPFDGHMLKARIRELLTTPTGA